MANDEECLFAISLSFPWNVFSDLLPIKEFFVLFIFSVLCFQSCLYILNIPRCGLAPYGQDNACLLYTSDAADERK